MMLKLNTAEKETVDEVYAETGIELADFLERALVRLIASTGCLYYPLTLRVDVGFVSRTDSDRPER